ncbi:gluconeogenesis factor YvcK family protein [Nesterenkonia sandarakina]|uniref:Putative gluconeogenesis factor n=1 Tax=Nesterenkonia sandarakina TaxID=272918 RepID=A0A2T0YLT9_9MICC|nr:uridine diphosphate-N-acetylglucosamine-binding protein YvcK [Nesterenkonia sandarakina]PRZ16219.1 putative cofD-like protein [Nesterenkonia sandarakina]
MSQNAQPQPRSSARGSFRVSALGGGHGLSATLSALRVIAAEHLTAIVTVADDGGSSGRLREDMDVLPPGDLRMALAALCDDTEWGRTWAQVMQHRFRSREGVTGSLDDHAMGNLLIVALWELIGDSVEGLRWAGTLLGARGQVLPMSRQPLTMSGVVEPLEGQSGLEAPFNNGDRLSSQVALATAGSLGRLRDVQLHPAEASACAEALTAIELSDWVVLGPGSWYTSVLPHLLLPELRDALYETEARRCIVMNLTPHTDETAGMSPAEHLRVLHHYAPGLRVHRIIADPASVPGQEREEFAEAAGLLGAEVRYHDVAKAGQPDVHDPLRLAIAFSEVFGG